MKILFFGDSITDCGRDRADINSLGKGYPLLIKNELNNNYEYVNTGVSRDRVVNLYADIKERFINHAPDIASILIGVNDVWHEISFKNGVEAPKYEKIYSMMIEEIKQALPNIKIMILEPFVLEGTATKSCEEYPDKWDYFMKEVPLRAKAARNVADKYGLKFIELQKVFDDACKLQPSNHWLSDGVHPTLEGHELIKTEWIKVFNEL